VGDNVMMQGHDHMDVLGSTLAQIASHKAGIMKVFVFCISFLSHARAARSADIHSDAA
jgi:folylpolyglutamate synthase/dihydropteroate synthase